MQVILEAEFIAIVENALKDKGWTRADLAREIGIHKTLVGHYLNGKSKPGLDMIERFFTALDLTPHLSVSPTTKPRRRLTEVA